MVSAAPGPPRCTYFCSPPPSLAEPPQRHRRALMLAAYPPERFWHPGACRTRHTFTSGHPVRSQPPHALPPDIAKPSRRQRNECGAAALRARTWRVISTPACNPLLVAGYMVWWGPSRLGLLCSVGTAAIGAVYCFKPSGWAHGAGRHVGGCCISAVVTRAAQCSQLGTHISSHATHIGW